MISMDASVVARLCPARRIERRGVGCATTCFMVLSELPRIPGRARDFFAELRATP
jgi:hypothetical protein